jgi:hypothetical protein
MPPELEFRKGVDNNLRVYKNDKQIGLIIKLHDWLFLAEPQYYQPETLIEIANKLTALRAAKDE